MASTNSNDDIAEIYIGFKDLARMRREIGGIADELERIKTLMEENFIDELDDMDDIEDMDEVELPVPCNGPLYKDWSTDDYFFKIAEEMGEAAKALLDWKRERKRSETAAKHDKLMLECTDIIVAVTSFMEACGCSEVGRQMYLHEVNESNAGRDGGMRIKKDHCGGKP